MGGPFGNYHNSEDYTFTISPIGASAVTLTFSSFDLETGNDWLKVYNGASTATPLITTLTGSSLPTAITASSGSMTLEFHSNSSVTHSGYEATYSVQQTPMVNVISPNGGENWEIGSTQTITWNDNITENVNIDLYKSGVFNSTIANSTTSNGSYLWTLPSNLVTATDYKIRISSTINVNLYDQSNDNFTVSSGGGSLNCTGAIALNCGIAYSGNTTGGASNVTTYSCSGWNESGPEKVHTIQVTGSGTLTAQLSGMTTDLDVFILSSCDKNNCLAYGDAAAFYTSAIPGTYYIVVDGYNGAIGAYTLTVTCPVIQPPSSCPGQLAYGGKTYSTIQIGTQCWLKENMNIGTKINGFSNQTNNGTIEKYCYNDLESNCDIYGGLYQWNELMQYITTEGTQGICPPDWHVPTNAEWCSLTQYLDPTVSCYWGYDGTDVGYKIKSSTGWSNNGNGSNVSGFTVLPAGQRLANGYTYHLTNQASFWSSTDAGESCANDRTFESNSTQLFHGEGGITNGFSLRCIKGHPSIIITTNSSNILQTSAISGGNVIDDGGSNIISRGVCWSESPLPIINNNHTTNGSGMGSFISYLNGLTANTTYYLRAYATNSNETFYGTQVVFSTLAGAPCPGMPTITDFRDGKMYHTVKIGTQCWLQENLNLGSMINAVLDQTNNIIFEKYCLYDQESFCDDYGGLYQWNEMMQYSSLQGGQGICPNGWHVPTDLEWNTLSTYLGGDSIAGGKMKEKGFNHWWNPNAGATNESGFTALPGDYRYSDGSFLDYLGGGGFFWSSTPSNGWAGAQYVDYSITDTWHWFYEKSFGLSCRCLKNEDSTIPVSQIIENIQIFTGQSNCYNATQTIILAGNGTSFDVQSGGSATMIAGQSISYLPTTTVQSGGYMWGYIAPTGPWCVTPSMPAVAMAEDEIPRSIVQSSFKVYPNPTTGNFILELTGESLVDEVQVDIYGMWGEKVLSTLLNGERKNEFSLSDKPVGVYFIRVVSGDKAETVKIIKQ